MSASLDAGQAIFFDREIRREPAWELRACSTEGGTASGTRLRHAHHQRTMTAPAVIASIRRTSPLARGAGRAPRPAQLASLCVAPGFLRERATLRFEQVSVCADSTGH